ncbi:glucuronyl esterase domain-containing protein [Dyadobacter arcticus]|uniref:Pimeloyl-ACP methyl ester carboxylesterase n=1 Tax=Dyadobacter arcticus TaxID=1078754 RepID=A0ABX0US95_9BACT|nr:prolyl oligopeptidase family serine peptidase [Dyadobacter arcticus]NIJ55677.1 pimeloyl-ACP methyl ester carboxylesterase [Dyadobacter arcticus]
MSTIRSIISLLLLAILPFFPFLAAKAQNYDESKVPSYVLPDALKMVSGKKVRNQKTWETKRRPEILKLFEDNIYGQMPTAYDSVRRMIVSDDGAAMGGKAILKQVLIEIFRNQKSVKINLVLFVPSKAAAPSPVFLLINNRGKDNTDPTRIKKSEFWPAEMLIDSGFAIATFHVDDLAPDNKDTYMNGVLQLYPEQLKMDNGMKAIGAWAWGANRVMDYFEKDKDLDAKKVIIVGHSRGGKASLWAAAQDQRFAACVTNCSGNSGAALARRQFGERISRINTSFPHWFNNNYKKFNDKENLLPVDQHMLIALVAPRPIYATNASKDLWADPKGTFLALKNAESTYALYGLHPDLPASPPGINEPYIIPPIAYHIRDGEHNMTAYDWANFIRFARSF